ncbi:MAG: hypothetical protein FWH35_06415 [Treponema sp.]|nr:hypothetical protein [Treponema sp.]
MKRKNGFLMCAGIVLILAIAMVIGCKTDSDDDGSQVPAVEDLPEFPNAAKAAKTEKEANDILALNKNNNSLQDLRSRTWYVVDEYEDELKDNPKADPDNYSFSDQPGDDVSVSANVSFKMDMSPNVKKIMQYYDEKNYISAYSVDLTTSDYNKVSEFEGIQGIATKDIKRIISVDEYSTTIKGSTFISEESYFGNYTATTAGKPTTAVISFTENGSEIYIIGATVDTSLGSVKIILDSSSSFKGTGKAKMADIFGDDDKDYEDETETYSGSLTVYGKDNVLLITKNITNNKSYYEVMDLFGIHKK